MGDTSRAIIKLEYGRTAQAMAQAADSGDHTRFTLPGYPMWSRAEEPIIRPDGIVSGRNIWTPKAGSNNTIQGKTFVVNVAGVERTITPADQVLSRPASDLALVQSIVVQADGSLDIISGTPGSGTDFADGYGEAGGPPYIPVGEVEVGRVYLNSGTDAEITATEIRQTDNVHTERADYPAWQSPHTTGQGFVADDDTGKYAHIEFNAALDLRHTGGVTKGVYAQVSTPDPTYHRGAKDWKPATNQRSSSATAYYDKSEVSSSESLSDMTVTVALIDGVQDEIFKLEGSVVTVWYFPDKTKPGYAVTQGTLGIDPTYAQGKPVEAVLAVSPVYPTARFPEG